MKEIPLTRGYVTLVDDEDYEYLSQFSWHVNVCKKNNYAVKQPTIDNKYNKMHRLLLGLTDPLIKVDHRDGDGLNNQRYNIRPATNQQNVQNSRRGDIKGVCWNAPTKSWRAYVYANGKQIHLGLYNDRIEAALRYDEAAKVYHGEFAKLNFPDQIAA
jgi:hypothetical protein